MLSAPLEHGADPVVPWWKKPAAVSFPFAVPLYSFAFAYGLAANFYYDRNRPGVTAVFSLLASVNIFLGIRSDGCRYDSRLFLLDNFLCWICHLSRVLTNLAAVDPRSSAIVEATQKTRNTVCPGSMVKMMKNPKNHDWKTIDVSEGCTIELFRPKDAKYPLPILLFFHGGGHCVGSAFDFFIMEYMKDYKDTLIVASVEYRLAPETPFPGAADDAIAALGYVHTHAVELGGTQDGICLGGMSAGGNLAAVALHHAAEHGIGVQHAYLQVPVCHVNCSGGVHHSFAENGGIGALPCSIMVNWWNAYCPDPARAMDPRCSPIFVAEAVLKKIRCRVIVVTASADVLRDSGVMYVEKLQAAGVDVVHFMLRGSHTFGSMCDTKTMKEVKKEMKKVYGDRSKSKKE